MEKQQKQRIITVAICIPLLLLLIWLGGWWLTIPMLALALVGCWEYYRLTEAIHPANQLLWLVGGCGYILLGFIAFLGVCHLGGGLWVLFIIWSTDTAAYEVGRRIGKTPLAPTVSPHKTVEGAVAGLAGGLLIGFIFGLAFVKVGVVDAIIIPLVISAIGQVGDLLESKVKRLAGAKDSGWLFPGHGGVLDRFDSLMLSSMFMYIFLLICR